MSFWRFLLRTLIHHWRINLAVVLGVSAGTAVLTGALLVGDSVRGSLRRLTVERLGQFDEVLVANRFFRETLAAELSASAAFQQYFRVALPAVIFADATLEHSAADRPARARGVMVIGCDERFWAQSGVPVKPARMPAYGEIVLNQPLAEELRAKIGDQIVLRLPKVSLIPADSPLGRKSDRVRSLAELTVIDIVAAEGLGRFHLRASQQLTRNAYLAIETLQSALDQPQKVNAILVAGSSPDVAPPQDAVDVLDDLLRPGCEDFGLRIKHVRQTYRTGADEDEKVAFEYFHLTSDRMLFEEAAERAIAEGLRDDRPQPVLTYLANSIEKVNRAGDRQGQRVIPYSTIAAIDSNPLLGPLVSSDGQPVPRLGDDEIVLNSWAAAELQARPGDRIRVTFFAPETTHGAAQQRTATFTLKSVADLVEPVQPYRRSRPARYEQRPSLVNDPDLTPEVPGITDQQSIEDWDPPFPFDYGRIRSQDDRYWDNYRTTPKALVSLSSGRRLWGSRFGRTTSFRIPTRPGLSAEQLAAKVSESLGPQKAALGFEFLHVKRDGLQAAKGTTPFNVLFLGFSFFIIAAALMLVSLLFRLGIEQRAQQVGLLLAVGLSRRQVGRLLIREGLLLSVVGGVLGAAAGVGYAWLMLAGLRSWWLEAVVTPFLQLYVTEGSTGYPLSLIVGALSGVLISTATIAWTTRRMRRVPVRRLIAGQGHQEALGQVAGHGWSRIVAACLLGLAAALGFLATRLGGEAQAGSFFGCGACVLAASLTFVAGRLRTCGAARTGEPGGFGLAGLALQNAARNPGRSTLTIGLMASACFLIVAISAFRLRPSSEGAGGFNLMAECDQPVFADLNTLAGREELLADQAAELAGSVVLAFRFKDGDDASCRNLYQSQRPRILGVPPALISSFDDRQGSHFAWAATAAQTEQQRANPWHLLANSGDRNRDDPLPVVLDKNTAMYSLHLYQGVGEQFELDYEGVGKVRFRVVGLLSNSILQGALLISEADLVHLFPAVSGYRYFLIFTPPDRQQLVASILEEKLSDEGFDVVQTRSVLEGLLAVQNTYLSTFQSLGGLGLLLGTFGLATVQLRNVLERRGELALLRAAGFRRHRLATLVMLENTFLLLAGLGTGVFSALLAVLPHLLVGGASVPLASLAKVLVLVLAAGVVAGLAAVRATLRAPLLSALRSDTS